MTVYHWLVDNGLWRDVLGFLVGWVMAYLLALARLRRAYRDLLRNQRRIANLLDTTTPGGLTDLVESFEWSRLDPGRPPRRG